MKEIDGTRTKGRGEEEDRLTGLSATQGGGYISDIISDIMADSDLNWTEALTSDLCHCVFNRDVGFCVLSCGACQSPDQDPDLTCCDIIDQFVKLGSLSDL